MWVRLRITAFGSHSVDICSHWSIDSHSIVFVLILWHRFSLVEFRFRFPLTEVSWYRLHSGDIGSTISSSYSHLLTRDFSHLKNARSKVDPRPDPAIQGCYRTVPGCCTWWCSTRTSTVHTRATVQYICTVLFVWTQRTTKRPFRSPLRLPIRQPPALFVSVCSNRTILVGFGNDSNGWRGGWLLRRVLR